MLFLSRCFDMPLLDVRYKIVDYTHTDFRVRLVETRNAIADEALLYPKVAWSGFGDRPRLDITLEGESRYEENGVTRFVKAGELVIGRALDSLYTRGEGKRRVALCIEWNLGSLGTSAPIGLPMTRIGEQDRVELAAVAEQLLDADETTRLRAPSLITGALARLRSLGLPFDSFRARDLALEAPPGDQRIADALGKRLSRLAERPSSADLEADLGVSRRTVTDQISAFCKRYGVNGRDWRSIRDRWRLYVAATAMSHPHATTEGVASAVGYGSSIAFCQAFRAASLPSPGNVRQALAQLS